MVRRSFVAVCRSGRTCKADADRSIGRAAGSH
jgi:hypothetical protein